MKKYLIAGLLFVLLGSGWFVSCKVQNKQKEKLSLKLKIAQDSIVRLQTPEIRWDTITLPGKTTLLPADTVFEQFRDTVWKTDSTAKVYTGSDSSEFLTIRWAIVSPKLYSKQFSYDLRQQIIEKDIVIYRDKPVDRPVETQKAHLRVFAGGGTNNTYFGGAEFQSKERWGLMYQYNTKQHQAGFSYRIF